MGAMTYAIQFNIIGCILVGGVAMWLVKYVIARLNGEPRRTARVAATLTTDRLVVSALMVALVVAVIADVIT